MLLDSYVEQVLENKIVVGSLVRKAVERHVRDLETGADRGLRFDRDLAQWYIDYFSLFELVKGDLAKQPLILDPWQCFIVGSVFGWLRDDGTRRFRKVLMEVARKNAKSTLAAVVGLAMLQADGEEGAEVYSAATKYKQAEIIFTIAKRMARRSYLNEFTDIQKYNISIEETGSTFEPLTADSEKQDGLDLHCCLIDELHAHPNRMLYDVLETAMGARRQPLLFVTSTRGFDQTGILGEIDGYCIDILNGMEADSWFPYIATLDEGDDWKDEINWLKANPSYGRAVKISDFKEEFQKALRLPSSQNNFKCKRLNMWVGQADRDITLELWDSQLSSPINEEAFIHRPCVAALDLSSVLDLTSCCYLFPDPSEPDRVDCLWRHWCPEARLTDDDNRYRDQYQTWHKAGLIRTTPGDAIDHRIVVQDIIRDSEKFDIQRMNIDRLFEGYSTTRDLQEGMYGACEIFAMSQSFNAYATPMREKDRLLLKRKINHGNNPLIRWQIGHFGAKVRSDGTRMPCKITSQGKIDGVVAFIMAVDALSRSDIAEQQGRKLVDVL